MDTKQAGPILTLNMATSWSISGPLSRGSTVSRYLNMTSYANELAWPLFWSGRLTMLSRQPSCYLYTSIWA